MGVEPGCNLCVEAAIFIHENSMHGCLPESGCLPGMLWHSDIWVFVMAFLPELNYSVFVLDFLLLVGAQPMYTSHSKTFTMLSLITDIKKIMQHIDIQNYVHVTH